MKKRETNASEQAERGRTDRHTDRQANRQGGARVTLWYCRCQKSCCCLCCLVVNRALRNDFRDTQNYFFVFGQVEEFFFPLSFTFESVNIRVFTFRQERGLLVITVHLLVVRGVCCGRSGVH